jgi:hypothetical protein
MVIPWVGFPLGDLLRRVQPTFMPMSIQLSIIPVWRVKRDIREPMTYAVVLAILLLVRIRSHSLLPVPSSSLKLSRQ